MARYHGNQLVEGGFYWNASGWEILRIPREGGCLPGTQETRYTRVPLLLIVVLGPLLGALYTILLPFIGFAMFLGLGGKKLYGIVRSTIESLLAHQES